tara:strand:+ start:1278 stop:1766 length:489 start_codon:yes stop_codon:yes gene_type:complete
MTKLTQRSQSEHSDLDNPSFDRSVSGIGGNQKKYGYSSPFAAFLIGYSVVSARLSILGTTLPGLPTQFFGYPFAGHIFVRDENLDGLEIDFGGQFFNRHPARPGSNAVAPKLRPDEVAEIWNTIYSFNSAEANEFIRVGLSNYESGRVSERTLKPRIRLIFC